MAYLLQHLLRDSAARAPQRPAVADGGQVLTYAELDALSDQVARALLAQGVAPGTGWAFSPVSRRPRWWPCSVC